jgi:Ca-activated chloride channel family protein
MRFEHPQLLWTLFIAVPALAAFFVWSWRAKRRLLTQFISARLLDSLTGNVAAGRQKARMILLLASVVLLIVVLARPQIGFSWDDAKSRGLDVVVAIDTSRSMLATDVSPNRLKRAQLAALDLKRLSRGDRFGLVAFAGSAFLQCPLTLDDEVYRQSVETLDVNIIPQGGTALAEAIQAALGAFKQGNDNHKVMVIFTDGEDHDGHALESAKAAAKEGLRIFAIGVGTPEGELLQRTDSQGRMEYVKDPEGNVVKSRLNEDLLRQVAQETGAFYMRMSGANTMNVLYERGLAPLPKGELASHRIKRYHERYQWALGLVIALLVVEMLLPERKQKKQTASVTSAQGLSRTTSVIALLLILALPCSAPASAGRALKEYESGRYEKAFDEYEQALKKRPDDPRLHFNAGAAAFENKDYRQSLEQWNAALVTQDGSLQQRAYYNIGNSQFRMGEDASADKKMKLWEESVQNYQSALRLNPQDADAEFNLQFVKKRLEELKQQQQQQKQQNKDDQKNKDKEQQQQNQQQNQDQQSKQDQQKQEQQKQEEQKQENQQGQKPEERQSEQQKQNEKQNSSKPEQKQGEENKAQQNSRPEEKQTAQEENAQPRGAAAVKMTPEQAIRLLEAFKAEEKNMPFRPILKTNRHDRVFKDW